MNIEISNSMKDSIMQSLKYVDSDLIYARFEEIESIIFYKKIILVKIRNIEYELNY